MRDKLAEVIADTPAYLTTAHSELIADATLAWLREYLGSDEVVARVAQGLTDEMGFTCTSIHARAALSSILTEPYEFSGWVEVVEQSDGR